VLGALAAGPALAIELGDPAPPLHISKWVKGKPVNLADGKDKNVYIVEFWATWCGPCRASIPHLTELQARLKDKGVVLISVSDEPADVVEPFVEGRGDKMEYTVACDDEGKTGDDYMKAFDQHGIPAAFVIDKNGKIVWVGHPMDNMDEVVDDVVAGKFDLAAAKKKLNEQREQMRQMMAAQKALQEYFELAISGDDAAKASEIGNRIVTENAKNPQLLNFLAWQILTSDEIDKDKRDLKLATKAAQAAYDASEGKAPDVVDTLARAFFENGKVAEAVKYEKQAIEVCTDDQMRAELKKTLEEYQSKLN
jgi:thiol-disulfide isomerase/thioredoxin